MAGSGHGSTAARSRSTAAPTASLPRWIAGIPLCSSSHVGQQWICPTHRILLPLSRIEGIRLGAAVRPILLQAFGCRTGWRWIHPDVGLCWILLQGLTFPPMDQKRLSWAPDPGLRSWDPAVGPDVCEALGQT